MEVKGSSGYTSWRISGDLPEWQLNNVAVEVERFVDEWRPGLRGRLWEPDDDATLAQARRDLAAFGEEMHASDLFFLAQRLRDAYASLHEAEPRYTLHYCMAEYAVKLAGEFLYEDALGALEEIPFGPASEPTLIMNRWFGPGRFTAIVHFWDDGTEAPFEAVRELRMLIDDTLAEHVIHTTEVEYHLHSAHAHELAGTIAQAEPDPWHLLRLTNRLRESVEKIVWRDESVKPAVFLCEELAMACNEEDFDAVEDLANCIYNWLPRDYRPCFPTGADDAAVLAQGMLLKHCEKEEMRFARVAVRGAEGYYERGDVPPLSHFAAEWLGAGATPEDIRYPNCFLFREPEIP